MVENGNGNCNVDPDSLIVQSMCVPTVGTEESTCSSPGELFELKGGWSSGEFISRCSYSVFERERNRLELKKIVGRDGTILEAI
ncbi:MAG: hypothetical protein ABIP48_06815, partial [Planctomycetota bacterium]